MASIYVSSEETDTNVSNVFMNMEGEPMELMTLITDLIVVHANQVGIDPLENAQAITAGIALFGDKIQSEMGYTDGCS